MAPRVLTNIVSGNVLLPGTKPLPEPMLTNHQGGLGAFTWRQFHMDCSRYLSLIWVWILLILDQSRVSQDPVDCIIVPGEFMSYIYPYSSGLINRPWSNLLFPLPPHDREGVGMRLFQEIVNGIDVPSPAVSSHSIDYVCSTRICLPLCRIQLPALSQCPQN